MGRSDNGSWSQGTFRIVVIYVIVGGLWIYLSDTVLGWLIRDPETMIRIAVFKGLLFIGLTASILYYLIHSYVKELSASEEDLKALMELMPVGVSWSSSDGKIEYVNHNFVERFSPSTSGS
jgi:PAS domain-containing protein